jgi:WD40 repeat protein/serine/threonine protein kinase
MAIVSACPDVLVLEQLALGRMPPAEVERLAQHCETCSRCIQRLQAMKTDDTLAQVMASQGTASERPREPAVDALIERLKRTPPPAPESDQTAAFESLAAPPASPEGTQAGDISLAPAQAPDEIGRLGSYRVLKVLGAGGMGMVYHAEDVQLQRPVALKVIKPDVAQNPAARERFLREARAAAKLHSDYVVNIHQVGEDRQVVFLAMELLEGVSLDDWLKKGRAPTLAQAARMGRQIALGLAEAHASGLIHRDIKPGNIWLDSRQQGRVKLLDFGLARGNAEEIHLTHSGAIVGTPAYMAPEQARGEHVDHRVDLFSLGVVLYRLTTGKLPFRGDNTMSILTSLALDTPQGPREINADIPPRMAALIERLLSKDRAHRPATAKAVADELAAIEREATRPADNEHTVQQASGRRQPAVAASNSRLTPAARRWLTAATLLLALGGAAAAIVVIIHDKDGNKIAELPVPPGGKIEIKDNGKDKAEVKAPPAAPLAAPLPPLLPGEPLAPTALVRQPAKLPGVRSWTIEPRVLNQPRCMAYRPDGKRLAVGTYDGRIHIWEPQTGRLVQVLLWDTAAVIACSLAWSPDGRMLAVGTSGAQPFRVWEAETGRPLALPESLPFELSQTDLIAWSPDGRSVSACSFNPPFSLAWNVADGKLRRNVEIVNGPAPFKTAVLSSDGKRLLGTRPGTDGVLAWDLETGKEMGKVIECKGDVRGLALSPDGKQLAWGQDDGLHVAEVSSGKEIVSRKLALHAGFPIWCWWSPEGKHLDFTSAGLGHVLLDARKDYATVWQDVFLYRADSPLAWSPDSKAIAVSDVSGGVCLLDAGTGKRLRPLCGPNSRNKGGLAIDGSITPDGKTLALTDGSWAFLAATDTGQHLSVLGEGTRNLSWSPNGKTLAANQPDGAVMLWEDNGKTRIALKGHHPCPGHWLAWSQDSQRLASSTTDEKRVLIWDTQKGEPFRELGPFDARAMFLTWSPDGRLLAFQVPGVGWHVWNMEKSKLANDPKQWNGRNFQFAPDGRSAVISEAAGLPYRLRDLATAEDRSPAVSDYKCVRDDVPVAFSPDGRLLATALWSSDIALLRGDLHGRAKTLHGALTPYHGWRYEFSQDGKLMMGVAGEYVHLWETDTGRLRGILLPRECYHGLTITPDGHYTGNDQVERGIVMVVQKDDGTQEVLEPADFEQKYGFKNDPNKVHLLQPLPPPLYPQPGMPMGPNALVREPAELPDANSWTIETLNSRGEVKALTYRPDGKVLATGGGDGTIRLWDTSSGKLVRMLVGEAVQSLAWSKDGILAAATLGWGVTLWEADGGRLLHRIEGGHLVAWSPDSKALAITNDDGRMSLWDRTTERFAHEHHFPINIAGIAWSPNGETLAVGLFDKTIRLWDVASWKETHKLEGHQSGHLRGLAWSPNGKRLVSAAYLEPNFYVWDAVGGKLQGRFALENPNAGSADAGWTPNGKAVVIGRDGLFDPENGRRLRSFEENPMVYSIAVSPDGNQVARGGPTGSHLLDTTSGKQTHTLEQRDDSIPSSLTWSADSGYLALYYKDPRHNQVVDAATGRQRTNLAADGWPVRDRSPDGRKRAIRQGSAVLLNDANGSPLGALLPYDLFGQLAVTADGRYRGNARVERAIRMVVQKRDGTTETLAPGEFEQKYGFKNDSATVRLTGE